MFILSRYLLRQFLQIFAICFLSMMGLYVVIDAFGHIDQFSARASQDGGLLRTIVSFYAYHSLAFFDRSAGALAMVAAMFSVAWLQRYNELTAIMAAGISKWRIMLPLILAAAAVSVLGVINREAIVPAHRDKVSQQAYDLGGVAARAMEPRFDARTDVLLGGDKIILAERRILNPAFVMPPALARYGKQLVGASAVAVDADERHPAGFVLSGVTSPKAINRLASLAQGDGLVVVTPADVDWLQPDQAFVASDVPFPMLASGSQWRSYATLGELREQLARPATDMGPEVRVAVHSRLVQPLKDCTLLMLGLPLMMTRRNRNVFITIGLCAAIATAFTAVDLACQSMGGAGAVRPTLAAWMPLLAFVPAAAALSYNFRT